MAVCLKHHKELNDKGEGKCSVSMMTLGGVPAGFCDEVAYGFPEGRAGSYQGYVPFLACYMHGGPRFNKSSAKLMFL